MTLGQADAFLQRAASRPGFKKRELHDLPFQSNGAFLTPDGEVRASPEPSVDRPPDGAPGPHNGRNILVLVVGVIACAALGVAFGFGIQALRHTRSETAAKPTALTAGTPFVVGTPEITRFGSSAAPTNGPNAVSSPGASQSDPTALPEQPKSSVSIPGKPNFYLPDVSSAGLSDLERSLFEKVNAQHTSAGLPGLALDVGLTKIARIRSQQMADQDYFGETDPFGYTMNVELLAYFGYQGYLWTGENISMNNDPLDRAAETAMGSIMAKPVHRANILAKDYYRIGVGEVTTADGRHIFTLIFLG